MKMYINGQSVDAANNEVIDVINPATGAVVDTVPAATKEDVQLAIDKATEAQKIWKDVPVYQKAEIMYRFLELVENNKEDLAQTLSAETGKPIVEARAEIGNIPISFKAFSERAKHLYGETIPAGMEAGQDKHILITRREPIYCVSAEPAHFPCHDQVPRSFVFGFQRVIIHSHKPMPRSSLCSGHTLVGILVDQFPVWMCP
jgi:succinate-semialdehyde dehydrogenase/glutarate-semialdehyde dehydrogenase